MAGEQRGRIQGGFRAGVILPSGGNRCTLQDHVWLEMWSTSISGQSWFWCRSLLFAFKQKLNYNNLIWGSLLPFLCFYTQFVVFTHLWNYLPAPRFEWLFSEKVKYWIILQLLKPSLELRCLFVELLKTMDIWNMTNSHGYVSNNFMWEDYIKGHTTKKAINHWFNWKLIVFFKHILM